MKEALDINFKLFLAVIIGLYASKRNYMAWEVYINADTLVYWKFKQIKQWCDEVFKIILNDGGFLCRNVFSIRLQRFAYKIKFTNLRVRPLEHNTL